jgi:hypothetical protein
VKRLLQFLNRPTPVRIRDVFLAGALFGFAWLGWMLLVEFVIPWYSIPGGYPHAWRSAQYCVNPFWYVSRGSADLYPAVASGAFAAVGCRMRFRIALIVAVCAVPLLGLISFAVLDVFGFIRR